MYFTDLDLEVIEFHEQFVNINNNLVCEHYELSLSVAGLSGSFLTT